MNFKQYILVGIIVSFLFVLFGILAMFSPETIDGFFEYKVTEKNATYISPIEKISLPTIKIKSTEIEYNTKPNFKVGEKFVYKSTLLKEGVMITGDDICYVDRIERINNTDYYLIIDDKVVELKSNSQTSQQKNVVHGKISAYINTETCKIKEIKMESEGNEMIVKDDLSSESGIEMYAPWMCGLKEGLEWEQEINIGQKEKGEIMTKIRYKVIGTENINGVECFKIIVETIQNDQILSKRNMWISKNKRILVKAEDFYQNLKIKETILNEPKNGL